MARRRQRKGPVPGPFLKWAGGKRSLLPAIMEHLPSGRIKRYLEPFVGGGAVFFALARERRLGSALLADSNPELINTYVQVRDHVREVIEAIHQWEFNTREAYYAVRGLDIDTLSPVDRAARTLYLNRTCFNGLYRLNSKGRFNVPFGKVTPIDIVDEENLRGCSEVLADVEIVAQPFPETMVTAGPGCVVYCDPPYWPVSKTASFTAYDQLPFGPEEQAALDRAFRALPSQGAFGLLSNSVTDETRALYEGLPKWEVMVRRSINRDAGGRGAVAEFLVRTP